MLTLVAAESLTIIPLKAHSVYKSPSERSWSTSRTPHLPIVKGPIIENDFRLAKKRERLGWGQDVASVCLIAERRGEKLFVWSVFFTRPASTSQRHGKESKQSTERTSAWTEHTGVHFGASSITAWWKCPVSFFHQYANGKKWPLSAGSSSLKCIH